MLADDIEYINDGTVDDDLDVWMEMLEDYHENGRIILVLMIFSNTQDGPFKTALFSQAKTPETLLSKKISINLC